MKPSIPSFISGDKVFLRFTGAFITLSLAGFDHTITSFHYIIPYLVKRYVTKYNIKNLFVNTPLVLYSYYKH